MKMFILLFVSSAVVSTFSGSLESQMFLEKCSCSPPSLRLPREHETKSRNFDFIHKPCLGKVTDDGCWKPSSERSLTESSQWKLPRGKFQEAGAQASARCGGKAENDFSIFPVRDEFELQLLSFVQCHHRWRPTRSRFFFRVLWTRSWFTNGNFRSENLPQLNRNWWVSNYFNLIESGRGTWR